LTLAYSGINLWLSLLQPSHYGHVTGDNAFILFLVACKKVPAKKEPEKKSACKSNGCKNSGCKNVYCVLWICS